MNPDTRNTVVVVALIASMTLGAWVLLELEPPAPGWSRNALLTADDGSHIEHVIVHYASAGTPPVAAEVEGVLYPDGTIDWRASGGVANVLVVSESDEQFSDVQARALLALLGNLSQGLSRAEPFVSLGSTCDFRANDSVRPAARQMAELLARKHLLRSP
ncbi:MAG: hypothetical protein D6744_04805 [Planctomycetota bacterium]|nr:MAG: hypothetical protein D6744_04805 [Planctomycetota bacterium]